VLRRLACRTVIAWRRERKSRVRAAVDEEGRQAVAEGGRRVVDGELGWQEVDVPVVLAPVGVGAQRIANDSDAVGPLHLGVGVLVVPRADDEARAHALDKGTEHLAGGLGVDHGEASATPEAHVANDGCRVCCSCRCTRRYGVHFARQEVDVVLDHVEPRRCRRQSCDPVHRTPPRSYPRVVTAVAADGGARAVHSGPP
jgi:hypothetical protein